MGNRGMLSMALYTTIYPGVEKFIFPWCQSLNQQTDKQIDVWLGVDQVDGDMICDKLEGFGKIHFILSNQGDTPAQIRERAIIEIVKSYDAVIFVDSDDVLMPTRVTAAKRAINKFDVYGCSLDIIDEEGKATGINFGFNELVNIDEFIYYGNIFGMSNTAYRTEILKQCLPIPPECFIFDWYLALSAWAINAEFIYDPEVHMKYRQYGENSTKILPPFTNNQIVLATQQVINHFQLVLENIVALQGEQKKKIEERLEQTTYFLDAILADSDTLNRYVELINQRPMEKYWWAYVAQPELEEIWKS